VLIPATVDSGTSEMLGTFSGPEAGQARPEEHAVRVGALKPERVGGV